MKTDYLQDAMRSSAIESDADAVRLHGEVARLSADNDDLRASAFYWKRLYEGALKQLNERADANSSSAAPGGLLPD